MTRRTRNAFSLTLLMVLGLTIATRLTGAAPDHGGTSFSARPRESTVKKYSNWMARLPDDVLLSRVSLPGTHDSCALYDGLSFGFAKCQQWQLADQLASGIRFLDIRCRHVDDRFQIYHGVIDQHMTFEDVRDVCQKFLNDHPSECIVMSVKEESKAERNSRSFADTFADATKNDGSLWHISPEVPELDAVRSRIVLIDRVGDLGGLKWNTLQRQDQYTAPLEQKTHLIRDHFEKAMLADDDQWFINFCSGVVAGSLLTPRKYALKSNAGALDFLRQLSVDKPNRLGTVVMDFPGEELIERIIESNFSAKNVN